AGGGEDCPGGGGGGGGGGARAGEGRLRHSRREQLYLGVLQRCPSARSRIESAHETANRAGVCCPIDMRDLARELRRERRSTLVLRDPLRRRVAPLDHRPPLDRRLSCPLAQM